MAKGNDGNLLQHEVELRLAVHLLGGEYGRLHLIATHAMAPMSPVEDRPPSPGREAFLRTRALVEGTGRLPESPYLKAWRRVMRWEGEAAEGRYPSTLRLLVALGVFPEGHLCEADDLARGDLLRFARRVSKRLEVHGDWRSVSPFRLARSPRPGLAWLATHDPYRYEAGASHGGFLGEDDLDRLFPVYTQLFSRRHRGALAFFSYGMEPGGAAAFRAAVEGFTARLADEPGLPELECRFAAVGDHMAGVVVADLAPSARLAGRWLARAGASAGESNGGEGRP